MADVRVSLVTCVWQRRALTRAFWIWSQWLQRRWQAQGITLSLVAAASTPEDEALALESGARVVMHENWPLGAKFNAALDACRWQDPDWVLVMGSDDFFCGNAADAIGEAVLANRSVGFRDMYFADLATNRVRYLEGYRLKSRLTEPVGCATTHSRVLLEKLKWRLWDGSQHKGMDHSRFATLNVHQGMPELLNCRELNATLLDVKTSVNLWSFDRTKRQPVLSESEAQAVWDRLPEDVLAAIPFPVIA